MNGKQGVIRGGMKTLLTAPGLLHLDKIIAKNDTINVFMKPPSKSSKCPQCKEHSYRIHSRYRRCIADLPWEGIAVVLALNVRKFFCSNDNCNQRVFCERLPEIVEPYGRKTMRLNDALTIIGFALGGRAGERAGTKLTLQASARTLLRRVRKETVAIPEEVRILGVDDFAFRKGQRYGTILVDQEQRQVIDLLPDRESSTLAAWLKDHPEIEIVTRDRSQAYAEGIRKGAPQATQIADRFHLLQNLTDALKRLVTRHGSKLDRAIIKPQLSIDKELSDAVQNLSAESWPQSQREMNSTASRQRRYQLYLKVKDLASEGLTTGQISNSTC